MSFWTKLVKGVGSAVSSFVPIVGPFVGDIISGVADEQETKDARKTQIADTKAMMQYQNDINVANWKMQNEYNTPSAQLARYQEAGINPLLAGFDAGSASGSPTVSGQSAPDISSLLQYQLEAQKVRAELAYTNEQTKAQRIENKAAAAEADVRMAEADATKRAYQRHGSAPEGEGWSYDPSDNTWSRQVGNTYEIQLAGSRLDDIIEARLNHEVSDSRISQANARLASISSSIEAKYGDQIKAAQLQQLLSSVYRLDLENRLNKIDVDFMENIGIGGRMASGIMSILLKAIK